MPLAQKEKTLYSEVEPLLHSDGGKGEKISVRLLLPFPPSFPADRCATQALPSPPSPFPPLSSPKQSFSGPLAAGGGGGGGGARKHKWARDLDGKRREGEASTFPSLQLFSGKYPRFFAAFPSPPFPFSASSPMCVICHCCSVSIPPFSVLRSGNSFSSSAV